MPSPNPASFFDEAHAAAYDERFSKLAPMIDALHLLTSALFSELPPDARILSVGAGTGAEILALGKRFPHWRFTAVEPSGPMLDVCRRRTREADLADRCAYHEGYLDSLPPQDGFHAATSILVSQFILEPGERRAFFAGIAERLLPGGCLVTADLSADMESAEYETLLAVWLRLLGLSDLPPEKIENIRAAYGRDVAITPPNEIASLLTAGGFEAPTQIFQSLLIRAWYAAAPSSFDSPEA